MSLPISKVTQMHLFTVPLGYCEPQGNHRVWKRGGGRGQREGGYYYCHPLFGSHSKATWKWTKLWMSCICVKLYRSQDGKTGRVEESRAEKPSCWQAQIWQVLFAQPLSYTESIPPEAVGNSTEPVSSYINPSRDDLACTELSRISAFRTAFVNKVEKLPAECWLHQAPEASGISSLLSLPNSFSASLL